MRILVHEFVSGGGLAGEDVPRSLAREGSAMLAALVEDLAAIPGHRIVTTVDPRFPLAAPAGVEVVTLSPGSPRSPGATRSPRSPERALLTLMSSADAVWLVAPETDRCLERLAATAERKGTTLLGPGSAAIRQASDKAALPRLLARHGVPHPTTRVLGPRRPGAAWKADLKAAALEMGYPLVLKPARGAGCEGVRLVRDARELRRAVDSAGHANPGARLVLQRYIRGLAASVSLLADGRRAVALTTNGQCMRVSTGFTYRGGTTPLDHPLAERAADAAIRACELIPGLRGYIGVDVVLTASEAVVIEVNPRLTTAYLGVRAALPGNIAALALDACAGRLPAVPRPRRLVHFSAGGRVVS